MQSVAPRILAKFAILTTLTLTGFSLFSTDFLPTVQAGSCNLFDINCSEDSKVPYCTDDSSCSIDKGQDIVKNNIKDIKTDRSFSEYAQDVVVYLLGFLGIVGVLYIIYSGVVVLTSAGDDEKVKKAKKTISSIAIGLLLIFLSYSIVRFLIGDGNDGKGILNAPTSFHMIPEAHAEAVVDAVIVGTFADYQAKVEELSNTLSYQYKVNGKITDSSLVQLRAYIIASVATFPENSNYAYNASLANGVVAAIDLVRKAPDSDTYTSDLATSLSNYFKSIRIPVITGKVTASPQTGNAPLTTSLRAETVKDPSGIVIPTKNYVWWIKTAEGKKVIGVGPSVSYSFAEERNYTVFLDVSSASRNSKGKVDTLPFRTSIDIAVLPKLGNVIFYLNGADVSKVDSYKITPAVGRAGVILDATSSQAAGGAKIVTTQWDFGNGVLAKYDGAPRMERQLYTTNGTYQVRLVLTTNENTVITKNFSLQVQDPIASIRVDKSSGFANEEFKFYSTLNAVGVPLSYQWTILDPDSEKTLYTAKNPIATYKFPRAGRYIVRLKTTTPNGREDVDTVSISIDAREPVINFTAAAASAETPNTFSFDATKTYDPDSMESSKLSFAWNIDGERIDLANSDRNGAIGKYTFSTIGTHKIGLEVSNEQWKMSSSVKEVTINSLLAVKLAITPRVAQIGTPVNFIAESKEAVVYEWDFGDGSTDMAQTPRMTHAYKKSGIYDVKLTVRGGKESGEANSITRKTYVVDANSPYALVTIKADGSEIPATAGTCDGQEAIVVDRTKSLTFSAENSVNVDGTANGLSYTWKYNGKSSTQQSFAYKFDELGCFPVSLSVKSQKTGQIHTANTYIKVQNLLPTFTNLSVTSESTQKDPVIVTVTANNASDPDGAIVSYLWYYYTENDAEPQDFRITNVNKTTFVLPRINGKYYFAVTMEDSNGERVNSDDLKIERTPFTLTTDSINTPLITLKTSSTNLAVGQSVDFKATVKNIIGTDITTGVEYKWDYNGDGFYDETTKVPSTKHVYDTPGSFNMKLKVTYKGVSNTKYQIINVQNTLKPAFEYIAVGKKFVFINTSAGAVSGVKWKLSNGVVSTDKDSFVYEYGADEEPGSLTLEISDSKETKQYAADLHKDVINEVKSKKTEENIIVFSYPRISGDEIHVTSPNDKVTLYLGESKNSPSRFVIDADIAVDSDLNGDATDDADNKGTDSYSKGYPFTLTTDAAKKERTVRLTTYGADGKVIATKDIKVILDYASDAVSSQVEDATTPADISDADKANMEKLKDLISTKAQEQDRVKLMQYFARLQESWFDQREKTQIIIDFESYISGLSLDESTKNEFLTLLDGFLIADSQTTSDIDLAVSVLKGLIPESSSYYKDVMGENGSGGIIAEILSHPTNITLNKELGQKILAYVKDDPNIENKDKIIIKSQLETIIYGGQANVPANQNTTTDSDSTGILGFLLGVLKVLGIIFGILVAIGVGLFVIFKISNENASLNFSDFIIDKFGKKKTSKPEAIVSTPAPVVDPLGIVTSAQESVAPAMIDPLASVPVVSTPEMTETSSSDTEDSNEAIVSEPESSTSASMAIPDWLKSSIESAASSDRQEESSSISASNEEETIAISSEEVIETPEVMEASDEEASDESSETPASNNEGLPPWLAGLNAEEIEEETQDILATPSVSDTIESESNEELKDLEDIQTPHFFAGFESKEEKNEAKEEVIPTASDDLPDWLRASISSETTVVSEEKTSEEDATYSQDFSLETEGMPSEESSQVEEVSENKESIHSEVESEKTSKPGRPRKKKFVEEEEDHGAEEIQLPNSISSAGEDVAEEDISPKKSSRSKKRVEKPEVENPIQGTAAQTEDLPDWLK